MNLPTLPELTELNIGYESPVGYLVSGYTQEQMKDYGKLCHNTALDEAIELVHFLRYNSVDYIVDCLTKLKG